MFDLKQYFHLETAVVLIHLYYIDCIPKFNEKMALHFLSKFVSDCYNFDLYVLFQALFLKY